MEHPRFLTDEELQALKEEFKRDILREKEMEKYMEEDEKWFEEEAQYLLWITKREIGKLNDLYSNCYDDVSEENSEIIKEYQEMLRSMIADINESVLQMNKTLAKFNNLLEEREVSSDEVL